MGQEVFTVFARQQLEGIHQLSRQLNADGARAHRDVLLDFMAAHLPEIRDLCKQDDPHATVEAGDLAVLCLELILEQGQDPDRIVARCYQRFQNKLAVLQRERAGRQAPQGH